MAIPNLNGAEPTRILYSTNDNLVDETRGVWDVISPHGFACGAQWDDLTVGHDPKILQTKVISQISFDAAVHDPDWPGFGLIVHAPICVALIQQVERVMSGSLCIVEMSKIELRGVDEGWVGEISFKLIRVRNLGVESFDAVALAAS